MQMAPTSWVCLAPRGTNFETWLNAYNMRFLSTREGLSLSVNIPSPSLEDRFKNDLGSAQLEAQAAQFFLAGWANAKSDEKGKKSNLNFRLIYNRNFSRFSIRGNFASVFVGWVWLFVVKGVGFWWLVFSAVFMMNQKMFFRKSFRKMSGWAELGYLTRTLPHQKS